jgi:hypothetical protein
MIVAVSLCGAQAIMRSNRRALYSNFKSISTLQTAKRIAESGRL